MITNAWNNYLTTRTEQIQDEATDELGTIGRYRVPFVRNLKLKKLQICLIFLKPSVEITYVFYSYEKIKNYRMSIWTFGLRLSSTENRNEILCKY